MEYRLWFMASQQSTMRILYTLTFALFFSIIGTFAQNTVSVDPLTGSAQVFIPIWQLSEGGISVPISVNYVGGGVKVEQGEGSAGMSWNLSAGGAVYRDMHGLPDDINERVAPYRKGWLYGNNASETGSFSPSADDDVGTCEEEKDDFDFFNGRGFGQDTEPDVFNFHAPGISGQFVFGNDGAIKMVPYQDLNIDYSLHYTDSTIQTITIQTNKGYTYYFTLPEQVTRNAFKTSTTPLSYLLADFSRFENPITYFQSWSLSKITSPGGAEITFSYILAPEKSSVAPVTVFTEPGNEQVLYYIKDSYRERQLSSINSNLANSIFDWEENRISGITIVDNFTGNQRKFSFYYKNVKDYRDTGYSGVRHSFLEKIMQEEDCITFPAYEFTYYGVYFSTNETDLSWAAQNMQDYWGYYNGTSATKKPNIYVYDSQPNAGNLRLRPIAGQAEDLHLAGDNRNVNATAIVTGSIKTIMYPSGSKTTIDYEPNSFFDTLANDTVQGGGIRVKKLTISDLEAGSEDIVTTYEYKQAGGMTSGQQIYRPVYALRDGSSIIRTADNQAPDGGILYARTMVKEAGKGSRVYEFLLPGMYPATSYGDWSASKSKIAREGQEPGEPCVGIGNQTMGYYSFPFAPSVNYDFERGLISKISTYSENATLVMERSFGYQRLSTTTVNVKALKADKVLTNFEFPASNFVYSPYHLIANVGKVMVTETTKTADEINPSNLIESVTSYTYSAVHNMLESVSSTNSDGVIYKTEYKYAKDFTIADPDTSKPEVVALKYLNDNFRHGSPVETIHTRKEGTATTTTGANLILYKDYGGNKILPEKTLVFPQMGGYTRTSVTGSNNQQLSYDTDYRETGSVKSYTSEGLPLSSTDNKKHKAGIHYGYGGSVPVAMVSNAWAEETVYDGFEAVSSFGLSIIAGTTSINAGHTGTKALHVTSANTLGRSGILKGNGKYILSCWVKPNSPGQLNYSCMGGSNASGNLPYTTAGQWQYLEKAIDVSGLASPFELQLSSSVEADLDEIRFYPTTASMSSSTSRPLAGHTSQTDDRGVSNFKEYDDLGRETAILDRNKNTVQRTEYRYMKDIVQPLASNFTNDIGPGQIHIGESATFTAPFNCVPVNYLWKVYYGTDSISATSPSLQYTFEGTGNYTVQLTVASVSGTSTSRQSLNSVCVQPGAGSVKFIPVDKDIYECEANHNRTIGVFGFIGCNNVAANPKYSWYYRLNSSNDWQVLMLNSANDTIDFNIDYYHINGQESFEIKCVVEAACLILDGPDSCQGSYPWMVENTLSFTYHEESQCQ